MACNVVAQADPPHPPLQAPGAAPRAPDTSAINKVRMPDGSKTINGFRVLNELGSGTFARVKLCEDESSGQRFAMKVFRKGQLSKKRDFAGGGPGRGMKIKTALDTVYSEIRIMKRIAHPSCIGLVAIYDEDDQFGKLYLVIEFAARGCAMDWDSSRASYLVPATQSLVPEAQAKVFAGGILQGLDYLHGIRIAHRDIKPQNLLVTAEGAIKIGDFGVSKELGDDFSVRETEGTYHFFAPEMCRPGYEGHDARKADVWAFGVTLWAFFYGTVPFFHEDIVHLLDAIAAAKFEVPASTDVSPEGQRFLLRALATEAPERPLSIDLLQDDWCAAAGQAS